MKILVIGGMHGNEPLGPAVVRLFQQKPIKNIDVLLANKPAILQNVRFVNKDLNRSFPGDKKGSLPEDKRAAEIVEICKSYDIVFDFHNTNCPENNCSFVGQTASRQLYDTSGWLGLNRVIVADYDCLNKYAPNCLSIEISLSSRANDPDLWYRKIARLAELKEVSKAKELEMFEFVYRMTLEDKVNFNLPSQKLKAFEPINPLLADRIGVNSPAYPLFINDTYTPYNYGGLLNKLN